jgi:hypothetical protein
MRFSIQTNSLSQVKEGIKSDCNAVRYGSEFCELNMPNLKLLKKAHELVMKEDKDFLYVTPLFSDSGIEKVRDHLIFLNDTITSEMEIVINDLGMMNLLESYPNLKPHLGRQIIFIPARCPWPQITEKNVDFFSKRRVSKIFYQTSLNYLPTIDFYRERGINGVDLDWINQCFPYYESLMKSGFNLSIYVNLIFVAVTRKCHTARFLGERNPEECTKSCINSSIMLKRENMNRDLFLWGNSVFRNSERSQKSKKALDKMSISEYVISMNPITQISSKTEIDRLIQELSM